MVDLIFDKQVHSILWVDASDRKELYSIETLLFSITDKQVYKISQTTLIHPYLILQQYSTTSNSETR